MSLVLSELMRTEQNGWIEVMTPTGRNVKCHRTEIDTSPRTHRTKHSNVPTKEEDESGVLIASRESGEKTPRRPSEREKKQSQDREKERNREG
jgi:hypothetical protein